MSKKINMLLKAIVILFILLLINSSIVYAVDMDKIIERSYDKIETEDGTFYKRKEFDKSKSHTAYPSHGYNTEDEDIVNRIYDIINVKLGDYLKKYTSEEYPENKRISNDFGIGITNIYSINDENKFIEGEDIYLIANISVTPINGNSNYWKENFSSNEFVYDEYENVYRLTTYCFVRLSKSEETNDYEITYIGSKPENYDQYISEFKETKGVDLENLDIEKILNTEYVDKINVVSSSDTIAIGADKLEYNSAKTEQVSNISEIIRISCTATLSVIIIICVIRKIFTCRK